MTLRQKQSEFVRMISLFVQYATQIGYDLSYDDAFAKSGHKDNSFHYKRLAVDFNLFNSKGRYLRSTKSHLPLGVFWETIGGTWGGRWGDGNHYSYGE